MHYVVIEPHRSEYPRPIRFAKGTLLDIGPRYEGEPGWQDWYLCTCAGQEPGWVPAQLIERLSVCQGRALDHYSGMNWTPTRGSWCRWCARSMAGSGVGAMLMTSLAGCLRRSFSG